MYAVFFICVVRYQQGDGGITIHLNGGLGCVELYVVLDLDGSWAVQTCR